MYITEATEHMYKLYGSPSSNEQIKLFLSALLHTYIQESEKYSSYIRSIFHWYSNRPLKFIFHFKT